MVTHLTKKHALLRKTIKLRSDKGKPDQGYWKEGCEGRSYYLKSKVFSPSSMCTGQSYLS